MGELTRSTGPDGGGVRPRRWPLVRACLVFVAGWIAFTWPWLLGRVTVPWDAKAHFFPQIQFLAQAFANRESVFWNPYVFAGHPQIADPQAMILSPPFLLLALLGPNPSFVAVDAIVFAMLGLGGLAVILLFRDRRWHWAGAVVAALIFCFGASAAWRVQHVGQILSLAWFALAYVSLDRALLRSSRAHALVAGLASAFMLLGRDQVALLGAYLLAARVLGHLLVGGGHWPRLRSALPPLLIAGAAGFAVIAIPLTMSTLFAWMSNRPSIDFAGAGAGSLHPVHLLTLFVPDLFGSSGPMAEVWGPPSFAWSGTGLFLAQNMYVIYVGAVPIVLLLVLGTLRGALFAPEARPFTIATLVVLLYALGWYTPLFRIAFEALPGVAMFRRPADATFLIGALLGVLTGYVVHRFLTDRREATVPAWRRLIEAAVIILPLAAAVGLAASMGRLTGKAFVPLVTAAICVTAAVVLLILAKRIARTRPGLAGLVLVAAIAGDLIWNNGPTPSTALPPAEYQVLRADSSDVALRALIEQIESAPRAPDRRDRVELLGLGFEWPNASITHRLHHTLGYNPVRIGLYSDATGAIDTIGLPDQRRFTPLFPHHASPLANMLGLRFILSPVPIETVSRALPEGALTLVGRPGGRYLYENPAALPRVVLATSAVAADTARLVATGEWPDVDFRRTAVVERAMPGLPTTSAQPGVPRIVRYTHDEVIVETTAPAGGGLLVLFDSWHPWWFGDVDGQNVSIERVNVLFRGVRVPAGQARVRFKFLGTMGTIREVLRRTGLR